MGKIIKPKRIEVDPTEMVQSEQCFRRSEGASHPGIWPLGKWDNPCQGAEARVGLAHLRRNGKDRAAGEEYATSPIWA